MARRLVRTMRSLVCVGDGLQARLPARLSGVARGTCSGKPACISCAGVACSVTHSTAALVLFPCVLFHFMDFRFSSAATFWTTVRCADSLK